MASAGEWVRHIMFKCQDTPLTTEEIFKSLEKHVGVNENTLLRVQAIADYIDQQMIERNDGPAMRQLWAAVSDYMEKVLEARAAA
jgi:hypothetical protein